MRWGWGEEMNSGPVQASNLPFDWDELKWVAAQAFRSNPRFFQNLSAQRMGQGWEPSILEDVLGSSPLLDYARQHLPGKVGDTKLGQSLPWNTPEIPVDVAHFFPIQLKGGLG